MVEVLRQNPKDQGMVQALSWFISKHSVGIYASEYRSSGKGTMTLNGYADRLSYVKKIPVLEKASGRATVETYILFHDHEGRPVDGTIVGRTQDGSRFLSKPGLGKEELTLMTQEEWIGKSGKVVFKNGYNIFNFS